MASAVDSRLAYARLSAVATASRLPTATRGSNNSYTTSWDTTDTNQVRAEVVSETDSETLQDFVEDNTEETAKVFTDDAAAYKGVEREHEAVRHSVAEYVRGQAHTNGIESFWAMLKRAHGGTVHKISPKHLQRYVSEFAGKHNIRDSGTLVQMRDTVARLVGRNLLYRDLVSDNGLSSGARS